VVNFNIFEAGFDIRNYQEIILLVGAGMFAFMLVDYFTIIYNKIHKAQRGESLLYQILQKVILRIPVRTFWLQRNQNMRMSYFKKSAVW